MAEAKPDVPFQVTTTVIPGPEYKPTGNRDFFMGSVYQATWPQPITVKTLNLNTEKDDLRPTGKGGGRQTIFLKLIAADSSKYVFRSVDKDVTKILPPELRNSIASDVLRDVTAPLTRTSSAALAIIPTSAPSIPALPTYTPILRLSGC